MKTKAINEGGNSFMFSADTSKKKTCDYETTLFSDEELLSMKKEFQKRDDAQEAATRLFDEQKQLFYHQVQTAIEIFCETYRMLPKIFSSIGAPGNKRFREKIDYIIINGKCVEADDDIVLWKVPNFNFYADHITENVEQAIKAVIPPPRGYKTVSVKSFPGELLTISNDMNFYWVNHEVMIDGKERKKVAIQANLAAESFNFFRLDSNLDDYNFKRYVSNKEIRYPFTTYSHYFFMANIIKVSYAHKSIVRYRDYQDDIEFTLIRPLSKTEIQARIKEDLRNRITNDSYFDYKDCFEPFSEES